MRLRRSGGSAARVPELVRELAALLDRLLREAVSWTTRSSAARSGSRRRRAVDELHRVDPGTEGLDIRRPSGASTVEWMITSPNGMSPISSSPEKIIRFSQSRMISRAVVFRCPGTRRELGRLLRPAEGRERPQRGREPGVEDVLAARQLGRAALGAASGSVSSTVRCPSGQSHTGSWWPHQICREMFQSGAFSSESIANRCCDSG